MMLPLLLLAAAAPQSAAEAERAYSAAAQAEGQWTAFRRFATDDAILFVPQPVAAAEFLRDRKDPPIPVQWWPAESYVSCDGSTAVNTGPWVRSAQKTIGYFTTVWKRQADRSWKWAVDIGDALKQPRRVPERVAPRRASCAGHPATVAVAVAGDIKTGSGGSPDGTLRWAWHYDAKGNAAFDAWLWDGRRMRTVVADRIAG
jgi:hypothetical protein